MALARLYPGFGSGKVPFEERYDCRSFASAGRGDLEASDKILLPLSAFKKVNQLRLPFPLTFRVSNPKAPVPVPARDGSVAAPAPEQFAGVLEFSAPEGVALLPQWMLQNLRLRDGGKALFASVRDLPRGTYARLQPHSQAFVELAASVGPRDLLEVALRNYSALSAGERIMIDVADEKYFLDVVEVRPGRAVSIYGNVDLEVRCRAGVGGGASSHETAGARSLFFLRRTFRASCTLH
jgi:ubiquitin fusion degradation protein 1